MRNVKLLWGIIVVLFAALVLVSGAALFQGRTDRSTPPGHTSPADDDTVVATIGDRSIKLSELNANMYHRYGAELLNQMLDRQAIQYEADELGMRVERAEIEQELKRMQQGYESEEQFYRAMKEQVGLSKSELSEDVYYKLLLERIATRGITVSDQELDAYIKAHPEEFRSRVQLHLRQIVNQTQEQANRTIELLRGGKDFAQLARDRSIDTATAGEGGDLGWVDEDDPFVPAPVMKAALKLKAGEYSDPVATDEGFVVVKLQERKEQSKGDAGQLRDALRKQLALQKARPLKEVTQELRNKRHAVIVDAQLR